jgi:hypothetical protein
MYRKVTLALIIGLVFCSFPVWAQFEGTITTTTSGTREPNTPFSVTQDISIKGKKVRSTMTSPGDQMGSIVIIYRGDKGKLITILDQAKMYMEYPLKTVEEMMKNLPMDTSTVTFTRTGKKQKILGYTCEEIIFTQSAMTIDIWGTTELPSLREAIQSLNSIQKQKVPQWSKELDKLKLFPMKTIITAQGTNAETNLTSIKKKKLSESLFEVPAGYTKQEMPAGQPGIPKNR